MTGEPSYVPALRFHWATALYDPVVRLTTRERTFRAALLEQLDAGPGERVLDLACGSGTLVAGLIRRRPEARVAGVDADARILARARAKLERAGAPIPLVRALGQRLPFAADSFDHAVVTLLFHHVERPDRERILAELRRVLRPGGGLHVADFDRGHHPLLRAAFWIVRVVDGISRTRDNARGLLPGQLAEAGFEGVERTHRFATPLGTLSVWKARA